MTDGPKSETGGAPAPAAESRPPAERGRELQRWIEESSDEALGQALMMMAAKLLCVKAMGPMKEGAIRLEPHDFDFVMYGLDEAGVRLAGRQERA